MSIIDGDVPIVSVRFGSGPYSVDEGATVIVTLMLSADPERTVVIPLAMTLGGGASAADFSVPVNVTFAAGEMSKTFTFAAVDDDVDDDGEGVTVGFGTLPAGVSAGTPATADVEIIDGDVPIVSVSFGSGLYSVDEGGSVTVTVSLDEDPERTVVIPLTETFVGGASAADFSVPANVTFAAGEMSKTFEFEAADDGEDDDGEGVTVGFGTLPAGVNAGAPATAAVSIIDGDVPIVSVSFGSGPYSVDEGATVIVTLMLSADPERTVVIPLTETLGGGASAADYSVPANVTFAAGETSKTFTFAAADDDVDDDDESVTVGFGTLPAGVNAGAPATADVEIIDGDVPIVSVSFGSGLYSVDEGGTVIVTVSLDEDPERTVVIPLTTTLGGGASAADFSVPANVTFAAGETSQAFVFAAVDDDVDDDGEGVTVGFGTLPAGVNAGTPATAAVSIADGDVPIVSVSFVASTYSVAEGGSVAVTVSLDEDPERTVVIPLTETFVGGASAADFSGVPMDVTFAAGEMSKTFEFEAADDGEDDDGEGVTVGFGTLPEGVSAGTPATAAVSIIDGDVPIVSVSFVASTYSVAEGGSVTVTVSLSADPERTVVIPLAMTLGGGASAADFSVPANVTFAAGEMSKTFEFAAVDDDVDDDDESVTVGFGTLPAGVSAGAPATAVVSIADGDVPIVSVSFVASTYSVAEGGSVAVTVSLDEDPERTVVIPLTETFMGGASAADYSVPANVTFDAGETSKTFTFAAADDGEDDDGEGVTVGFGTLPAGVSAGTPATADVEIIDGDVPIVSVATLSGLVLNDGTNDLTLTPAFATDTASYAASVGGAVSQVTVTPTKSDTDASVEYLDARDAAIADADGAATGQQVDLAVGTTTIKVEATAGDAMTTETYTVVVTRAATRPAPPSGKAWVEVWSDDFDGDVVDATKWRPQRELQDLSTRTHHGNTIYYRGETDNVGVADGKLVLKNTQRRLSATSSEVLTARISTMDIYHRKYGYFEASVRIAPTADGIDTVFWLQGPLTHRHSENGGVEGAADGGEIDILESSFIRDGFYHALHWDYGGSRRRKSASKWVDVTLHDGEYHVYAVEWSADRYRFYIDGKLTWTYTGEGVSGGDAYIVLSTGVSWAGGNAHTGDFPVEALFDWVRVYELQDSTSVDAQAAELGFGTLGGSVAPSVAPPLSAPPSVAPPLSAPPSVAPSRLSAPPSVAPSRLSAPPSVAPSRLSAPPPVVPATGNALTHTSPPAISSVEFAYDPDYDGEPDFDGPDDDTYPLAWTVSVEVNFDRNIDVQDLEDGGPRLELDIGGVPKQALYYSKSSRAIVFFYRIQDGDEDMDGISIGANKLALNGASIVGTTGTNAVLNHAAVPDDAGHKVDGVRPVLQAAETSTDGATIVLTYDEALQTTINNPSNPKKRRTTATPYRYTVSVDGVPRGVSDVSASGSTVTLELESAVTAGQTVAVSYREPSVHDDRKAVQNLHGTDAASFTNRTVTVAADDDPQVTVGFEHSAYSVAEGSSVTVTVSLDEDPERTVVIPLTTAFVGGASAADFSVPANVTFDAGEMSKTFEFEAADDDVDDDGEGVTVGFGTLPAGVSAGTPATAAVSITDGDVPTVSVSFGSGPYSVDEGETVTVTLTLSADPERTVVIPLTTAFVGGASAADFSVPANVTFDAGETSQAFTFAAADDDIDDDDESVTVGFGTLPAGVNAGTPATADVEIGDDDVPTVSVSFVASTYSVAEGGSVAVTVSLSADPERTVEIPLATTLLGGASAADFSGVPMDVTFAAGEMSKTFEFAATDDDIDDDGESVELSFGTLPGGVTAGSAATATVSVADDDTAGVVVVPTVVSVAEGGAAGSYTVVLATQPPGTVTVTVGGAGDDVAAEPAALTFTASTWDTAQTVTVTAVDDSVAEGEETATLTHAVSGYGAVTSADSVTVTITAAVEPPNRPNRLMGTAIFVGGVDLEWTDVPGAESYEVQLFRNVQWIDLPGDGVEIAFYGTGAIISQLNHDGYSYWFQVRANNAKGSSEWSDPYLMQPTYHFEAGRKERPENVVATGAPAISGTAQVGKVLTADASAIEDGNGLNRVKFQYQWVSYDGTTDTDIEGATESAYRLQAADEGKTLKVRGSFIDRHGYAESLTSAATPAVLEAAPNIAPTGAPAISGPTHVGGTLTASVQVVEDQNGLHHATFQYRWVATDGTIETVVQDSENPIYVLEEADEGKTVQVDATFTDDDGYEETLLSVPTGAIGPRPNRPATGDPTIVGTVQVGETLTVDISDIEDADGLDNVSFSYQWLAGDADIAGATGDSYTLVADDKDKTISVRVSFTDRRDFEETLTSAATAPVDSQRVDLHILNAPVGEHEAVLYRSTASLTPVHHIGDTHDSREDRPANFKVTEGPTVTLPALDRRQVGELAVAISATALTIPLTSIDGLRVGESIEIGAGGGELMRIASVDSDNKAITIVERYKAHGESFVEPQAWPADTVVYHHRRARPERLPGYMSGSGEKSSFSNFRMSWQGVDVPYLAINVSFSGSDTELKDWRELLVYLRFRRADGEGRMVEGILPIGADGEMNLDHRQPGDPYTVREQHLRRYFGWPENLGSDPRASTRVSFADDARRLDSFISGPERTFLQEIVDWIYADDGHDLGRIYPMDDRYDADEVSALQASPDTVSEELVRSYQVVVDVAFLDGTDPRIDTDQFSILTSGGAYVIDLGDIDGTIASSTRSGSVNRSGDEYDHYRFTLSVPREVQLELTNLSGAAELVLESGSRTHLLRSDESGLQDELIITVLDAGVYQVRVQAQGGGTIDYQLRYRTALPAGNSPATGVPSISGTVKVGETLTASTSAIDDADGLPAESEFDYQWIRNDGSTDANIAGATDSTYVLLAADVGKFIKVRVTFTDENDYPETLTSAATTAVPRPNRDATGVPTIDGAVRVGETLTAVTDGIADADGLANAAFNFIWARGIHTVVAEGPSSSYVVADADVGSTLKVRVTFIDDGGNVEVLTSEATEPVPQPNRPATGAPTIDGTARVGETLTAVTDGIADLDGLADDAEYSYQWLVSDGTDDLEIDGATSETYEVSRANQGNWLKVRVTFTDDGGNTEVLTSEATAEVAEAAERPNRPNRWTTGAPTIAGTVRAGETVTAVTDGIADADGLTNAVFRFVWLSVDVASRVHTTVGVGPSYVVADADVGSTLKVLVSVTDDEGNIHWLLSAATEPVAPRPLNSATVPEAPDWSGVPGQHRVVPRPHQVTLDWSDPDDDSITHYTIRRHERGLHAPEEYVVLVGNTGSAETRYIDDTVEIGRTYRYSVAAVNDTGQGAWSSNKRALIPSVRCQPTGPCIEGDLAGDTTHVGSLAVTDLSDSSVTLGWETPAEGPPAPYGYVVVRRLGSPGAWAGSYEIVLGNSESPATTWTDDGVAATTTYTWWVLPLRANGVAMIADAPTVTATTPAAV